MKQDVISNKDDNYCSTRYTKARSSKQCSDKFKTKNANRKRNASCKLEEASKLGCTTSVHSSNFYQQMVDVSPETICDLSNVAIYIPKRSKYSNVSKQIRRGTVSTVGVPFSGECLKQSIDKKRTAHSEWVISRFLQRDNVLVMNSEEKSTHFPFIPLYSEIYLDKDTTESSNTHLIGVKDDYSQYLPRNASVSAYTNDYSQFSVSPIPSEKHSRDGPNDVNSLIWLPPIHANNEEMEPGEIPYEDLLPKTTIVPPSEADEGLTPHVSPSNESPVKTDQYVDSDVWHNDMYLSYLDDVDLYPNPPRTRRDRTRRKHQRHHKSPRSEVKELTESTSQSELEEESENINKLRTISHLWRKKERRLSSLPAEEGEVPLSEMKVSFFKREGIDLKNLSKEESSYLEDLEKRHQERWDARHGIIPTENYMTSLKEHILQVLRNSTSPVQDESEEEEERDPLKEVEQQQHIFEQLQQRRRVIIPFQPAPDVIFHKYYPPNVYLRYSFILNTQDDETAIPAEPRSLRKHDSMESQRKRLDRRTVTVKGFKPWVVEPSPSKDIKEQALPESLRKQLEEVRFEETKAAVRLQRANDSVEKLTKEIDEKEQQLRSDIIRHNKLIENLQKRIEENKRKLR